MQLIIIIIDLNNLNGMEPNMLADIFINNIIDDIRDHIELIRR